MDDLTPLISLLKDIPVVALEEVVGCSDNAIQQLEKEFGVTLPGVYKSFLRIMGERCGDLFLSDNLFVKDLKYLQLTAREWSAENATITILPTYFFFFGHHGYQFMFFNCEDGDNPPGYLLSETYTTPECVDSTLSSVLFQMLEAAVLTRKAIGARRLRRWLKPG